MRKIYIYSASLFIILILSGCSFSKKDSLINMGGVIMSVDSGNSWESRNKVDEEKNISGVEVLSVVVDPADSNRIFLGTKSNGLIVSENNAENWQSFNSPASSDIYGVAVNYFNSNVMYVSGTVSERGKIFKTQDGGENWEEIYTEPADGTYITYITMDNDNPEKIFVGTSKGVILKTSDGGRSWDNLYSANGPISKIIFDKNSDQGRMYYLVYKKDILVSDLSGDKFEKIDDDKDSLRLATVYSMENDESSNRIYVGTNKGLFRSYKNRKGFEKIDIIASSENFPIRSIAINPFNSDEIVYSSAHAIYKSNNSGESWSTFQLNTSKFISDIKFNRMNTDILIAGFRDFN